MLNDDSANLVSLELFLERSLPTLLIILNFEPARKQHFVVSLFDFFVWSQTELLYFPFRWQPLFSCCRSSRVFKLSLSKQRNLCGSDQSLYMYLCRRVYWTPLPKWWVVSMLINCWHVKGSVEWSWHKRHFRSLLPYHCDFKLALKKKSRPCRGTFARANQADRCMNFLHCAQRSTPWLLDKHGFDRNIECFSLFERYVKLPVCTWLIPL